MIQFFSYSIQAEGIANETSASRYAEAVKYLKEADAEKVLARATRAHEFQVILETFHQRRARKRRLIELLNNLDRKPIIKTKRK